MRIIAAGGGSGGHVTPVLAVINELKKQLPKGEVLQVMFICDHGFYDQARQVMDQAETQVTVKRIHSGKLRRFHTLPWWKYIRHPSIMAANLRDSFLLFMGLVESLWIIARFRPDVVFTKGGFVCVPVGVAAKLLGKKLAIHDSDAHPGLTNRILARFATAIATGYPLENYSYPSKKSYYVGVPISEQYGLNTEGQRSKLKGILGLPIDKPLVVVTGGGLGAALINKAVYSSIEQGLLAETTVVHITGAGNFSDTPQNLKNRPGYFVFPFVDGTVMASYINASDVVVTRAGATTLLELSAAGKPTIIIPNALLTGGHQLKNAQVYAQSNAAVVIDEQLLRAQEDLLLQTIVRLLHSPVELHSLSQNIHKLAKPDAAEHMVRIIIETAKGQKI